MYIWTKKEEYFEDGEYILADSAYAILDVVVVRIKILQICSAILHGVSADYFVLIFIILLIVKALLNFIVISLYFIIAQSFMSLLFSLFSFSSELDQESLNIL
ncbi:hypothetical protein BY996DRAFT_6868168 [Phakopsora pachyrhizi]|nr:hypothetical protein BY996DRAFT_6868168 [Phakopsora pachyrhizi]